ncbi:MAG: alkaline phosphatase family protein [Actinomycetota bacterium]
MNWLTSRRLAIAIVVLIIGGAVAFYYQFGQPLPTFREQACGLPPEWLERIRDGYSPERSGEIAILPHTPAYLASGEGGWTHSGPWPYLQNVPLVWYGPGIIPTRGDVERPVTLADVVPTIGRLLKGVLRSEDGAALDEVAELDAELLRSKRPRLVVVVVWDGGGWNVLRQWPDAWPTLARLGAEGISFTNATVGSSPSVTPPVHTTLGTGRFPYAHGVTDILVRDGERTVDSFLNGESSRFVKVPTLAERWDVQTRNKAKVGMVGYEPWHLGMIGQGAEREGGDRDDAAWVDVETNEWKTNPDFYRLPPSFSEAQGPEEELARLDIEDGSPDQTWRGHRILDDPSRIEETPAFIAYHGRLLTDLIEKEGYGSDATTDLLFTNFKQIDRLGHYFNMASPEVRDAVVESDRQLGVLVDALDGSVGKGRWVMVVTADHGQQPDADAIDGYGIDGKELRRDIEERFGPVIRSIWPTQVFLDAEKMETLGVRVEEVARFIGGYRLRHNTARPDLLLFGAGRFSPGDRLFDLAIPAAQLPAITCER